VPDRREFDSLSPCPHGSANRAPPRTGQGAVGGCVHPHPAAFVKGAAGGGERSGDSGRELARRGRGLEAAACGLARRAAAGGR
jgi:hypothetical protein